MPSRTTNHVLVIGVDGVRYDTLRRLSTPGIDAIERAGFLRSVRVNDAGPTISGPGWATIFTGVPATDHKIMNNELSPNCLSDFPDMVHQTRARRPEIVTYVAASWAPLVTTDSGGPLFADGGFLPSDSRHFEDPVALEDDRDEQVTSASEKFLRDHDGSGGSLVVTYLGAPDEIAHELGTGDTYDWAVSQADSRIERILKAIEKRTQDREDWTVIAVTDHGHVDSGGHGGESIEERTAWIAACGPGVPQHGDGAARKDGPESQPVSSNHCGPEPAGLEQADVAAHALWVLDVAPKAPAQVIGRSFDTRFWNR